VPGCWTYKRGREFIAVNPHDEMETVTIPPDGGTLDLGPHCAAMFVNGWIVYIGHPFDGRVFMITEDDVITRIRALQRSVPKGVAA